MTPFYRFLWLCTALLLATLPRWANALPAVELPADQTSVSLQGHLLASPDDTQYTSPAEALAALRRGEFAALQHPGTDRFSRDSVWLAFQLSPSTTGKQDLLLLQVGPAYLDRVTAYLGMPDGSIQRLGDAGDQVLRQEAAMAYLKPTFAFRHPVDREHTLLLRLENRGSHAAYAQLFRASHFPHVATQHGLLLGVLLTIGILMLGMALGLYLLLRQRIYWLWLSYVGFLTALLLVNNGLAYQYLSVIPSAWLNPLQDALTLFSVAVGALFVRALLDNHNRAPRLARFLKMWGLLLALLGLASLVTPNSLPLAVGLWLSLPLVLLGIAILVAQALRGNRLVWCIGLPLALQWGVTAGFFLTQLGWLVLTPWLYWGWHGLTFLSLVILQTALLFQALAIQRGTQQERTVLMQLLTDKNQELEVKVKSRTRDLETALRDVQQAEAEQRQLLSMASHEFRTPAAMIKMSLDSLRFLADSIPPEVNARLDNIRLASQRLTLLTNSLIADNRLREPRLQIHPNTVALDQMVRDVAAGYPASTPIQLELPPTPVVVQADAALLSIALHNLIDNALNHGASSRPRVTISLQETEQHITLAISDNGPGIPDSEKQKVFERFQRRNASRGSGLGLSIVSAIVRAHQGSITVRDNRPQGTRMVIQMPKLVRG